MTSTNYLMKVDKIVDNSPLLGKTMQQPELNKEILLPSEYIKMLADDIKRRKKEPLARFDLFMMSDMINAIIIYLDAEAKLNDIKTSEKFQNVSGDVPGAPGK